MSNGNVIYEMNPVGEINVPHEDKAPNMNDDGKGKISIASGGSGGGIRTYNVEKITSGDEYDEFIIHGMSLNDIYGFYYFHGVEPIDESTYSIITCPYTYILEEFRSSQLNEDRGGFVPIGDVASFGYFTEPEKYLDGIKVKRPIGGD